MKPETSGWHHHRMNRILALAALLLLGACGGGGGSSTASAPTTPAATSITPATLAVLIAQGDATSEAIGSAYQAAHGIPAANVIRLTVPAGSDVISAADFTTLKATLDGLLPAAVQATLVTWTQPSRVAGPTCSMSLTSALAFGWDPGYCGGCAATRLSAYYDSSSHAPFSDLGLRPSMMLGAAGTSDAQALISRGVASSGLVSKGGASAQGWLVRTSDAARSVRYTDFQLLAAKGTPGVTWHYVDNSAGAAGSDLVVGQSNVLFYFTGLASVGQIGTDTFLPGAVADTLTSFGGLLPSANGQMPATAWLQAGVTGSYGTVEEPCATPEKFPRASVLAAHYAQGDTLIEAYWKSVQMPGQGLFVGEPLARPWAP